MQNIKALGIVVIDQKIFSSYPYVKHVTSCFLTYRHSLNKLRKDPLNDATF